jgi:biotin operon repressor
MTEVLKKLAEKNVPTNSYIRAMYHFSGNKKFNDIDYVNKELQELGFEPAAKLEDGQRALRQIVVNAIRPTIDPEFKPVPIFYEKGEINMNNVSDINTSAKVKSTSKVVKVNQQPRKSKKSEKFEMLLSMLNDAGASDTYVNKEVIAQKIGATPGSVGVMISELRKDKTLNIESTKQGYRIVKRVTEKVA